MTTTVTFNTEATNLDHLIPNVRIRFGDLTGATYSDTIIRTALVNAIGYLQPRWQSKYQIFTDSIVVDPQPAGVPSGYLLANTSHGQTYIPDGLTEGSAFRNPYVTFVQPYPPTLASEDEEAIVLAAVYLLRSVQISSSLTGFVSWSTEDIRYSNLGSERGLGKLLEQDLKNLNDYFMKKIAKPQVSQFPVVAIDGQIEYLMQNQG
jgi:hypothetical protein